MRLFMMEILSGDLEKPGKRGGRSVVTLVYNRLHEAFWQGFSVSKIYYSYRSENKNDGKILPQTQKREPRETAPSKR
ncbi:hypothetical protein [Shinella zoogloeoides]|uniref:hypothetical protein n=1 Tax=Shinella zoogloeoides TaxID=352475 RepID=UPI00299F1DFA|nr:hypothetical protein [Shinella zoogloeoides]